jgi:hypothetical protein
VPKPRGGALRGFADGRRPAPDRRDIARLGLPAAPRCIDASACPSACPPPATKSPPGTRSASCVRARFALGNRPAQLAPDRRFISECGLCSCAQAFQASCAQMQRVRTVWAEEYSRTKKRTLVALANAARRLLRCMASKCSSKGRHSLRSTQPDVLSKNSTHTAVADGFSAIGYTARPGHQPCPCLITSAVSAHT